MLFKWFITRFPRLLPRSTFEFEDLCALTSKYYDFEVNEDFRATVGGAIIHAAPHKHRASLHYFGTQLHKSKSNSIAWDEISAIKKAREERDAAQKLTLVPPLNGEPHGKDETLKLS